MSEIIELKDSYIDLVKMFIYLLRKTLIIHMSYFQNMFTRKYLVYLFDELNHFYFSFLNEAYNKLISFIHSFLFLRANTNKREPLF
jgi:hypothetical protein